MKNKNTLAFVCLILFLFSSSKALSSSFWSYGSIFQWFKVQTKISALLENYEDELDLITSGQKSLEDVENICKESPLLEKLYYWKDIDVLKSGGSTAAGMFFLSPSVIELNQVKDDYSKNSYLNTFYYCPSVSNNRSLWCLNLNNSIIRLGFQDSKECLYEISYSQLESYYLEQFK